jgi:hypothetical protein
MTFPVTVAPQDRELVMALAATALRQAAPEELVLLDETATDYFTDPASTLAEDNDEAISAGIDVPVVSGLFVGTAGHNALLGESWSEAARACAGRARWPR